MASTPFKQLKEHLDEQQKPFALEVYIAERKILLNKKAARETPYNFKIDKKRILNTSEFLFLKFIFHKFIDIIQRQGQRGSTCCKGRERVSNSSKLNPWKTRAAKGYDKLGSFVAFLLSTKFTRQQASTDLRTCHALKREIFEEQEADADINCLSRLEDDNEQYSPVSVLDEIHLSCHGLEIEEVASTSSPLLDKNSGGESIISILLWELLTKTLIQNHGRDGFAELREIVGPRFSLNQKKQSELKQQKQLLLDCVKEAIEVHRRKHKRKNRDQEFISLQELGKFITEQICSWREDNASPPSRFDASRIVEEWNCLHELNRGICIEIADSIMDQIILELTDSLMQ